VYVFLGRFVMWEGNPQQRAWLWEFCCQIYQSAEMKRGLQMDPKAVEECFFVKQVNHYPCGFIIHPNTPWLGSSPDGLVWDLKAELVFGLLEVKCPNVRSYVDWDLRVSDGVLQLKRSYSYYWQVQGQLLILVWSGVILSSMLKMTYSFRECPEMGES